MTTLSVSLTEQQAEKSIDTLTRILSTSKGEERKVIKELLDKLAPQLDNHRKVEADVSAMAQIDAEINRLAKTVLDMLPTIQKRGLTASALRYVESVSGAFNRAEKRKEQMRDEKAAVQPRAKRHLIDLTLSEIQEITKPLAKNLSKLGDQYLAATDERLSASDTYTQGPKREALAKKCFASAIGEGRGARDWNELDMVSMCFGDMLTHMKLAEALLDGNPKKIDRASSMDTATRENLANSVWNFVRGDGMDDLERVTKAPRPKR